MSAPSRWMQGWLVSSYLLLIAVNVLSQLGYFGPDNAELSAKYSTPLTPAGWAFSIWGLIFLLEGVGVVWALLPQGYSVDGRKLRVVNAIGVTWQTGWICEIVWQLIFTRDTKVGMWFCVIFLLGALVSFARGLQKLYALRDDFGPPSGAALYSFYLLPTSVNTAWLSVASCLGILVVPKAYGWSWQELVVPSAVLGVAVTLLGLWIVVQRRDSAYGLTLVWALLAVWSVATDPLVHWVLLGAILAMCIATIRSVLPTKAERGSLPAQRSADEALLRQMAVD